MAREDLGLLERTLEFELLLLMVDLLLLKDLLLTELDLRVFLASEARVAALDLDLDNEEYLLEAKAELRDKRGVLSLFSL